MNRWLMAAMAAAAGVSLAFSSGPAAGKDKRAKRDRPEAPPVQGADGSTPTLDIYFIDVEGGAATLIVTPQRESVLIDSGWPGEGGRDAKRIESAARSDAGLTQIDHYITTHWHTDHYGGIENLAKLMPVRHFWDRGIPAESTDKAEDFPVLMAAYKKVTGGNSRTLSPGDRIPLSSDGMPLELKVVAARGKVIGEGKKELPLSCGKHIPAPFPDESDNMLSLALLLRYGKFQYLNCGDLTWNIEHKLVCPKNRIGHVDLWQVTHHGWKASSNPALVEAIKPQCAVIVNGARKGASPETYATLRKSQSLEAIYQLHYNVTTTADDNTSPERIANLDENCQGEYFRARVSPDADRYTISKGANKPLQTFVVR